jgi:Zn-dependent peptidase ImmA (M78 family)
VEPTVLRWARESIGLTEVAASRRLDLPDDRVTAWESGAVQPSIAQLKKAAALYKRSLAVFFLPQPPTTFDTLRDFRRQQDTTAGNSSPGLHTDYRRALEQREYLLELAEIDDVAPPTAWRVAPLPTENEDLARAARRQLLAHTPVALPRSGGSIYDHLNMWIAALETADVLVMATAGGRVDTAEMRGFSLYFDVIPVIVVNGADAPRGRLFTLMHECAHLLLHTGGLCDTVTDTRATTPNRQLEARCNAIAASILMPDDAVLAQPGVIAREHARTSWDYDSLVTATAPFGTSAEAFLRRLLTLGRVDQAFHSRRRSEFLGQYEEEEVRARSTSGGDWYRNAVRDRGKGYVRLIADAHRRRAIDSTTAARFLDAKVSQIPRLAEAAALRAAV